MPSLASSLGWKLMKPSGIQRRAPLLARPMCGMSTSTSSTSAATNSHGAQRSHSRSGTCTTASEAPSAISRPKAWRTIR